MVSNTSLFGQQVLSQGCLPCICARFSSDRARVTAADRLTPPRQLMMISSFVFFVAFSMVSAMFAVMADPHSSFGFSMSSNFVTTTFLWFPRGGLF